MGGDAGAEEAAENAGQSELRPGAPVDVPAEEEETGAGAEEVEDGNDGDGGFSVQKEHGRRGEDGRGPEPGRGADHFSDAGTGQEGQPVARRHHAKRSSGIVPAAACFSSAGRLSAQRQNSQASPRLGSGPPRQRVPSMKMR